VNFYHTPDIKTVRFWTVSWFEYENIQKGESEALGYLGRVWDLDIFWSANRAVA